jgi:hypothetical protein
MVMGLGSLHLQQRLSVSSVIGLHAGCLYQRDVGVENLPIAAGGRTHRLCFN